jgi:hypothetical protein
MTETLTIDTQALPPAEGDPAREAWLIALRAEIFGLNASHEAFKADASPELAFPADAQEIRRKAAARRKLRRERLNRKN